MTARNTHDADLCERIRELEKRLEELERRPTPFWVYPRWGVNPPYWTNPWPNTPTITYGTTSIGNTTSVASGAQTTYTAGSVS